MEAEQKRTYQKQLYKNARGRTPPWKEVYRKRCMDRLRSSRSQLVDRFRSSGDVLNNNNNNNNMVQNIMEIEWANISHANSFPSLSKLSQSLDETVVAGEDQAMLLSLLEEIQKELISEEERLLTEVLNYDAAAFASQVALQQNEEVICPVCQVQRLRESNKECRMNAWSDTCGMTTGSNVLSCSCGLALQGANLTLNTVKSSLENTVSHHEQTCCGQMIFTPTTDSHGTNVLITCNVCDWMSFLL